MTLQDNAVETFGQFSLVRQKLLQYLCRVFFNFYFMYIHIHATPLTPPSSTSCPVTHRVPDGPSPRRSLSDSEDDDLPNVTLDRVNETGSTALTIARAVQE